MKGKKILVLALASLCVVGCAKRTHERERAADEDVYAAQMGAYSEIAAAAKAVKNDDERLIKYAEAEAELLGKAVMMPYSTQGGSYAITRVAPRTIPYSQWGNDEDRLKGIVAVKGENKFITTAERNEMLATWAKARGGEGTYDPAAYLTSKGYELATDYKTTFSTKPATLDILNTSEQSDTEVLINMVDGLLEYDNFATEVKGNIATKWESKVLDDGKQVWTFHLRDDAKWTKADGTVFAPVVADDFVASFQHMLDTAAGLEFLVDGIVVGVSEYLAGDITDFSKVGVEAVDEHTLTFTLCQEESYFPTRLTYSCFMPMSRAFFQQQGGQFGIEEFKEASASASYTYGSYTDINSQVYNGAYIPAAKFDDQSIALKKNPNYHLPDSVKMNTLTWVYDNGENMEAFWADVLKGTYVGCSLTASTGTLDWAKEAADPRGGKIFDVCNYVTDTTTTTYLLGVNLNRGTYVLPNGGCETDQNDKEIVATNAALQNIHFRRAIFRAWDRVAWNAVTRGEDMAATNLRNCYTAPTFLSLSADTKAADGHEFKKGTTYGELVQYFGDKAGLGVNFADGQDGWYNKDKALEEIKLAKEELGEVMDKKIKLDIVYYSASTSQVAQADAFKQTIEAVLGDYVKVCLVEATTSDDFYASGYRAATGKAGNFDLFYGSGWGPDYGDASTYLDTFLGDGAGYMTKIIGLF